MGGGVEDLDRVLLLVALVLALCGLALIYSADHGLGTLVHFRRQAMVVGMGLCLMAFAGALPPRVYYGFAYVVYTLSILGLAATLVLGVVGMGARRWVSVGGLSFQPSEMAKAGFVLASARWLSFRTGKHPDLKALAGVAALCLPPFALVLGQPDLGTAMLFPLTSAAMLAWYGLDIRYFMYGALLFASAAVWVTPVLALIVAGGAAGVVISRRVRWPELVAVAAVCGLVVFAAPKVWNHLKPYQQRRLTTFLNPAADPLGSGYQIIQSKVAVGSGGWFGRGYLKGTQSQLKFLPQQHTDFVFALAGEEFGWFGATFLLGLLLLYVWRTFILAGAVRNQFMSMVTAGIASLILLHCAINLGMVVGLLPVTGVPLPFLSYGGSFLLTCLGATGVALSASIHRRD